MPKTEIKEYLRDFKNMKVFFKPNPGNAGDALIAAATFQVFDELELDYSVVVEFEKFDPRGKILVYGGGGNLTPKNLARSKLEMIKLNTWPQKPVLNCFRTDREGAAAQQISGNIDISRIFDYGAQTRGLATYSSQCFLRYLNVFDTIRTNRLHVAIAAALMGKNLEFFPNSYYKNQAVYDFSMTERFERVHWMGG